MSSTRADALIRIMQIEDRIKKLISSKKYRNIQNSITLLKRNSGNAIFMVNNPENPEKLVEVRRNSKESQRFLAIYEHQLNEYQTLLGKLGEKKKTLTFELFE